MLTLTGVVVFGAQVRAFLRPDLAVTQSRCFDHRPLSFHTSLPFQRGCTLTLQIRGAIVRPLARVRIP